MLGDKIKFSQTFQKYKNQVQCTVESNGIYTGNTGSDVYFTTSC